jgi:hypothetical protein
MTKGGRLFVMLVLVTACGSHDAQVAIQHSPTPMIATPAAPIAATPLSCPSGKIVSDADQLKSALTTATAGDVIVLMPGTYSGRFTTSISGAAGAPITLCGARDAVLDGGPIKDGYTLYLNGASWWRLLGFSIEGGQKGVVTDRSDHVLISRLFVHDIGDEGIHLRAFSNDDTIDGVTVRRTGLLRAKFGEGIYIGTANSNWCRYTNCTPDTSDRNVIENSDVAETSAENIDIKEGTTGGQILNNQLSGDGMSPSGATAWVNVKGNSWTIAGNSGVHSIKDGFQVHRVYAGWGNHNVFRGNKAEVDGPGFGFYVQSASLATVIGCDNVATGAALGLSNTSCTP